MVEKLAFNNIFTSVQNLENINVDFFEPLANDEFYMLNPLVEYYSIKHTYNCPVNFRFWFFMELYLVFFNH